MERPTAKLSLRDVTSVETFKKNLKTFLLKKAFADRFTLIEFYELLYFTYAYYNYYILLIISILIIVIRFTILFYF